MTASYNLADLFEGAADELGAQEAVVAGGTADSVAGPTVRLSYTELDERANRVANHLLSIGVEPGDHVGVHLMNRAEFLEILFGVFKLGAVPINGNFRYTADELRYVFEDAEVAAVFTESHLAEVATEAARSRPLVVVGGDYEDTLSEADGNRPDGSHRGDDDHFLLYTGGTTGMPKGVIWRHVDLFFGALGGNGAAGSGQDRLADPADIGRFVRTGTGITRRLPLCPLIHGGAQWTALHALLSGGTCLLVTDQHFDAASALRFAADERAEFLMVIGDAVARPLADELAARPELYDLSELRLVSSSGAILSPAVKEALTEQLPATKIIDRFGSTETGGQGRIARDRSGGGPLRLLADATTTVLDDDLQPLPPGSGRRGWLARSGWIPLGYWRDEEKTRQAFPVVDGVRYSVPGDLATIAEDGSIVVFGRGSMVINSGGEKVFPEEVEAAAKSHPAVLDALVVGVADDRYGERVAAVISTRNGTRAPSPTELADHCRTTIAGYKVPREVIVVDAVRRKVTGKGDYAWARQLASTALS